LKRSFAVCFCVFIVFVPVTVVGHQHSTYLPIARTGGSYPHVLTGAPVCWLPQVSLDGGRAVCSCLFLHRYFFKPANAGPVTCHHCATTSF
jgi:hypothetical protein